MLDSIRPAQVVNDDPFATLEYAQAPRLRDALLIGDRPKREPENS